VALDEVVYDDDGARHYPLPYDMNTENTTVFCGGCHRVELFVVVLKDVRLSMGRGLLVVGIQ